MQSIGPTTGAVLETHPEHDDAEMESRLARVHAAALAWAEVPFERRAEVLIAVAEALDTATDSLAEVIVKEMGKPLGQAKAEVEKCAWVCRYFAEHGAAFLADEPVDAGDDGEAFVAYRPLGVVLAILPWNIPLWQAFRFVALALMAGNGIVVKPAAAFKGTSINWVAPGGRAGTTLGVGCRRGGLGGLGLAEAGGTVLGSRSTQG